MYSFFSSDVINLSTNVIQDNWSFLKTKLITGKDSEIIKVFL